ncbi:MAG TPA: phytanoyl-CoA dioxygenase family protein [Rhodocyclaceae bacterium]|nr:phytanoyl-CoA dioxygenase family protein [Rhodocyclaceae bacterium]
MDDIETLISEYRDKHYIIVRGFYPQALVQGYHDYLRTALSTEVAPIFAAQGLDMQAPDATARVARHIAEGTNLDPAIKQVLLGHFPLKVRLSERINPLALHLGQSTLLKRLLNSEHLFMHMPAMMRFVPPHYRPAAVPPHQDSSYNAHMDNFVTVWTPLVPIDKECGGMIMYEGSQHRTEAVAQGNNGWLEAIDTSTFPAHQLVGLEPGDVVILSPQIVHGSAPNVSNRTRLSMDLRIFGEHARSSKHHMNLDTLEILAA